MPQVTRLREQFGINRMVTVFMNGKMVRVRHMSPLVDGASVEQFLVQNGNAVDLMEHEL